MVSKLEKIIYNLYFCYVPIIALALAASIKLVQITPTRCLFDSFSKQCIFYRLDFKLIYHPLNIINLILVIYTALYIYYNVVLKQDVVGKTVKRIYSKTKRIYKLKNKRKQLSILLFCYCAALLLSYFRFSVTLWKII